MIVTDTIERELKLTVSCNLLNGLMIPPRVNEVTTSWVIKLVTRSASD